MFLFSRVRRHSIAIVASVIAVVVALTAVPARADDATWIGTTTDWNVLTNWSTIVNPVPGTGNTATFSSTGVPGTSGAPISAITAPATVSIRTIAFDSTAQAFFLGGTINLDTGGSISVASGAALQTVAGTFVAQGGTATILNNGTNGLTLGITANAPAAAGTTTLTFDGTGNTTTTATLATASNTATLLTAVVKNGSGTLTLANTSNTNIFGGFAINAGTVIALNANSLSNRGLTIAGGTTIQMNAANAASQFGTGGATVQVNGDTTWIYGAATGNWNIGVTSGIGILASTNNPTITFSDTTANINGIRLLLNTSGFAGTFKLGQNGSLTINNIVAAGSNTTKLDMGDAGTGVHYFATGTALHNTATQAIVPLVFGELKGTDATSLMGGRQNIGTGTTGTQFQVGALNSNSTYAGQIRDGHTANGNLALNGLPDATNQTTPFTSNYARNGGAAGSQGTVEFVKVGNGTLTLTGTNSHTGGTVVKGGTLAVNSDAALGATYDGSLRLFQYTAGTGVYTNADLPDAALTGGSPTTAASVNVFSAAFGNNANNNLYLSFTNQVNDSDSGVIRNNNNGAGYKSVPTVSFTGGTFGTAGTVPVASVRVTGLLTLDGGTLQTTAAIASNRAIVLGAAHGTVDTNGFNSTLGGVINGAGNFTKAGVGTLDLAGSVGTYTGSTTVTGGTLKVSTGLSATSAVTVQNATLESGAANVLPTASPMTLSAGTWNTGGFGQSTGALTSNGGTNQLLLGNGAGVIAIADSSAASWEGTLQILGWSGNVLGGGTDQVLFGNSAAGLTGAQLATIAFVNPDGFGAGSYGAVMLFTGEIVPVPEPATSLALAALALAGAASRRRFARRTAGA